jgi:hypothetical protein
LEEANGTSDQLSSEQPEITEEKSEFNEKKGDKENDSESEEEKYAFEDIASGDIFFSCVYNQYCRKPGVSQSILLSQVSYS